MLRPDFATKRLACALEPLQVVRGAARCALWRMEAEARAAALEPALWSLGVGATAGCRCKALECPPAGAAAQERLSKTYFVLSGA